MNNIPLLNRMFINGQQSTGAQKSTATPRNQVNSNQILSGHPSGRENNSSEFEDIYNELESNYVEHSSTLNINYQQFYEDLHVKKWERVISEENVDDEECKESQISSTSRYIQN